MIFFSLINIAFIIFTLLGGILFGFIPALSASIKAIQKELNNALLSYRDIIKQFLETFKTAFIPINLASITPILFGIIAITNINITFDVMNLFGIATFYGSITVLITSIFVLIHLALLQTTNKTFSVKQMIKLSFIAAFYYFPLNVLMVCFLILWLQFLLLAPGISLFFGISVPIFICTVCYSKTKLYASQISTGIGEISFANKK
ncbi:hypothetical protein M948_08210 [Virgibacillus sp. CM-4]|uniref:DUF624 domain-containing protein n=1 Tax=Virgibacillus sp. CM-4 TaxID=1354277 RepID=UPI000388223D|nr:DUF624 domain-containing protein [Virgibacillus sp. CM-4]EQB38559.1 hypothetical protein M948_08210 [Virgibacillus sp. CM-4]